MIEDEACVFTHMSQSSKLLPISTGLVDDTRPRTFSHDVHANAPRDQTAYNRLPRCPMVSRKRYQPEQAGE